MKSNFLSILAGSPLGENILTSIVITVMAALLFIPNPLIIKNAIIRYLSAIGSAILFSLLLFDLLTVQVVSTIGSFHAGEYFLVFISAVTILASTFLSVAYYSRYKYCFDGRNLQPSSKTSSTYRYLFLLLPVFLFFVIRNSMLDAFFSPPAMGTLISSVFITPIIEESIFRVILPKSIRVQKPEQFDFIVLSLLFQILHLEANNLMPLALSLYLYYAYSKTHSIFLIVFIHSIMNCMYYCFPYV